MYNSNFKLTTTIAWQICFVFCLATALILLPEVSMAAGESSDGISDILCKIVTKLTGPIGKGIATIAIVVLGIGLFLGKLSWALAIATAIGIGFIFSASKIVNWLAEDASSANACSGT